MKKLISLLVIVLMVGFLLNCGGGKAPEKTEKTENETAQKQKDPKSENKKPEKDTDSVPVQVVDPYRGNISSFILFSSNMDSEQVVDIYPMTSGIVEKILYDEGDNVKKGAVLAILDEREALINEQKARINYEKLKMEFGRQKEIYEKQMVSKEEYDRFRYNLETARLDWEQNRLLLSYTRITSPINGVVTKKYFKVGNRINTSQVAFSVVNTREKIAVVNIPEQEKNFVFIKQKSVITAGDQEVAGFVKRISPAIDPESGTFKVTVAVSDLKNVFAIGQFVNVKIIKKVHENVILLTKDALLYEGGKVYAFIIDKDNKAQKKLVKLGFEEGNVVEVSEGLAGTEKVVTAGKSSLKTDTAVKVVDPVT
jgi:membrane fusion protein (multidrug efflux system)